MSVVLGVLFAALVIALVAKRFDLPYSIALVVGGIGLASLPGMPPIELRTDVAFYLLLPPILFEAAYFTSLRDFWRWRRAIFLLAIGLVAATSAAVAVLLIALVPGMTWAPAFALGAIVSPPDAAAATSILRSMRLPRRVVQILEGESLVNDASGLTLYRFAVLAAVTGSFSFVEAIGAFAWMVAGGTVVGLLLGYGFVRLFPYIKDPDIEILSTFLISFISYYAGEAVHASGVLSTVAAGLVLGWYSPSTLSAAARIRGGAVWQTAIFLLNASIFLLIGLQLPAIVHNLSGYSTAQLIWWSAAVSGLVIVLRLVWVFPATYIPRWMSAAIRRREPAPHPGGVLVVAWTGLRGIVSLAAAFALPAMTASGAPFPFRDLFLLLASAVILSTLVIQGLTLRPLIRVLAIPLDRSSEAEQLHARVRAAESALARVNALSHQGATAPEVVERVRGYFEDRLTEWRASLEVETGIAVVQRPETFRSIAEQRLWWEVVRVQRETVIDLRRNGEIGDEALHELERDIDFLEARIVPS